MNVIIIGAGHSGVHIANLLLQNHCQVKVVEHRTHVQTKMGDELPEDVIVFGDGTNPEVLEKNGISKADVVIAVTGKDETNLVASTIAKYEFGVPRVIARVNNTKNAWLFDASMGVDVAINQADLMAHIAIDGIDMKNMMTMMKLGKGDASIIQIKVEDHSPVVNCYVKDLSLPGKAVLIALIRQNETIITRGDTQIKAGDLILAFVQEQAIPAVNKLFAL